MATTCDFQQCAVLTSIDSDELVQPPFKLRHSRWGSVSTLNTHIICKRLAKALIRLRVCADWYAQSDLWLCWSHIPHCWKCHVAAQILFFRCEDGDDADKVSIASDEVELSDDDFDKDFVYGDNQFMDEETRSRFTSYSMSSSVIRRNEGLTLLDDRLKRYIKSILFRGQKFHSPARNYEWNLERTSYSSQSTML